MLRVNLTRQANNTPGSRINPQLQADIVAIEDIVDKLIEAIRNAARDGVPRVLQQAVERMARTMTAEGKNVLTG